MLPFYSDAETDMFNPASGRNGSGYLQICSKAALPLSVLPLFELVLTSMVNTTLEPGRVYAHVSVPVL